MQNHNRKSGELPTSAKKQITQYDHTDPDQKIADHICHICISFKITFSHPTISSPYFICRMYLWIQSQRHRPVRLLSV